MRRCILVLTAFLVACKGADGATGPQGPAGAQGANGPTGPTGPVGPAGLNGTGNRVTFSGVLSAGGSNFADLPPAAGTLASPPAYACYLLFSVAGAPAWLQTGDALNPNSTCALGIVPGSSVLLRVVVAGGTSGQGYAIVVVY